MVLMKLGGIVQASNEGVRENAELKSRLAVVEAQAQREAAACAEAKQEASEFEVQDMIMHCSCR